MERRPAESLTLQEPWYISWRTSCRAMRKEYRRNPGAPLRVGIIAVVAVLLTGWVWQTYAPIVPMSWFNLFMILPLLATGFALNVLFVCACPRYLKLHRKAASVCHGQSVVPVLARCVSRVRVRRSRLGEWIIIRYEHPKRGARWAKLAIPAKADRERLDVAIAQLIATRDEERAKQAEKASRQVSGRDWFAAKR